jgi:nucleoside-diphosphate-sugar epimerase
MDLKNKKILVTGGNGFLGKELTSIFKAENITNFTAPSSKDYDLRLIENAFKIMEDFQPDLVVNIAARLGGIGDNRAYPASYFYDNLMLGINMIEACRIYGAEKLILIGTVCSYPKNSPVPFKEEDLWNGYPEETNGPYGVSKRSVTTYAQAVKKQYGLNTVNLLFTNLYGAGDDFRDATSHVIPAIIKKIVKAKEDNAPSISAWGDGSPTRDFLHVKDAAYAVINSLKYCETDEPINVGSGTEVNIKYLIEKIVSILDFKGDIIWDTTKPNGQPRRVLDITKAKTNFQFSPKIPFDKGLEETIHWYLSNRTTIDALQPKFSDLSPFDHLKL